MSATQRTENYNLPIFIETDKPAWLVDFNGAMRSIDAQMKANAEAIATKSPILTFQDTSEIDFTKTGDIVTANLQSAITDKVGRALVTPLAPPTAEEIVAINTNGNQDVLGVGSGLIIENGQIETEIDMNLSNLITLPSSGYTARPGTSGTGSLSGSLTAALNDDRSIGKIYGGLYVTGAAANADYGYTIGLQVEAPADGQQYLIDAGVAYTKNASGTVVYLGTAYLFILGDGAVVAYTRSGNVGGNIWMRFDPNIYYFKNFGDTQ